MPKTLVAGVTLALSFLTVPSFVHAQSFDSFSVSPKGKVTLTAQVGGFAGKGSSVSAPPGAPITLNWTIPKGWKGCWSNWESGIMQASDATDVTGSKTATIPSTLVRRLFVLTCFGIGQAQTVGVTVNIVKPDIAVVRLSAVGKKLIPEAQGISKRPGVDERKVNGVVVQAAIPEAPAIPPVLKNTYEAGAGAITFTAVVKNVSKSSIPAGTPIQVVYEAAQRKNATADQWIRMGEQVSLQTTLVIDPGATPNVQSYAHEAKAGGPWFFRARVVPPPSLNDASEKNNASSPIGPYYFK